MSPTPSAPLGEDDAVARLRAADPAAGSTPDLTALRAAVDARAAASGTDELSTARARRWASWPARTAAAAAVALVVGSGGGYAIGAAGDDEVTNEGALPPIAVSAPGAGEAFDAPGAGTMAGPASGGRGGGTAADGMGTEAGAGDMAYSPYWSGRTVFTAAAGLPGEAGSAEAWAFDPSAAFTAEAVAAAAAALGVEGEPRQEHGSWVVGSTDGTSANVSLYGDGMVNLNYWDPAKDPWSCLEAVPMDDSEGREAAGVDPCQQRDLGAAPTGDAATAVLRDAMAALGIDVSAYELTVESWGEEGWSYVTAHHVVAGQRTGMQWSASLTGAGMQSLYGFTAPLVPLGEYDVISAAEAVERLGDPRFSGGWGGPIAWVEGREPAGTMEMPVEEEHRLPDPVAPGSSLVWPVAEVTVVDARLGLTVQSQPDGAAMVLPTYELIGEDGGIWSVIAVAEHHLDFSTGR